MHVKCIIAWFLVMSYPHTPLAPVIDLQQLDMQMSTMIFQINMVGKVDMQVDNLEGCDRDS